MRGERSSQCLPARFSVVLVRSPANMASRCASRPHSRASRKSSAWVSASSRFFDRSAKTCGASWLKAAKRPASWVKAVRRSKARPLRSKVCCSSSQAAAWSQRRRGAAIASGRLQQLFELDGVGGEGAYAFGQLLGCHRILVEREAECGLVVLH